MSVAPSPPAPTSTVRHWVRDWLLLEGAERQVRALSPERQALVRRYYDAGTRRAIVADDLTDDEGLVAAFTLYREAAGLLGAAVVASTDPAPPIEGADTWDALAALAKAGRLPALPPSLDEARQLLAPTNPLAFDDTAREALRTQHATVRDALRWLRDRIEPRTLREIRFSRGVRLALGAVVVVILLVRAVSGLFAPTNLALHKTVTISQRHPASVAPPDNSGLVNGEIEPNYGIHTAGTDAWVKIDLGDVYPIGDVVVHNRADGWVDEGLPFGLELSENGSTWTEIDRRTTHFTAAEPWVAQGNGRKARYVRVRSSKYIALTEVEVHKAK